MFMELSDLAQAIKKKLAGTHLREKERRRTIEKNSCH